ncbi:MAG: hypothetical protein HYT42_01330 [Candidatus Sungbacteria bacterium]|nr:hypothetical protein [Candidatus Sungbacteria bacterium]
MRQTIITVIIIVLVLGLGWAWFKYVRESSPGGVPPKTTQEREREFNQYRQLNDLRPDIGILSNPVFESLEPVQPSPAESGIPASQGRVNPFLPFADFGSATTRSPVRRSEGGTPAPGAAPSTGSLEPVAPLAPLAP